MNNSTHEQLENLPMSELKQILVNNGISVGKGNRSKNFYIDMIEKHYFKNAEKHKMTEKEKKEIKIKTQKLLLNQKRDSKSPLKRDSLLSSNLRTQTIPRELVSSKSLKDLKMTSNKQLSKIDLVSQCAFKLDENKSCCIQNFIKNLDYKEIAKISAGCFFVFGCYYYLTNSGIQLSSIKNQIVDHKEVFVALFSLSVGAIVAYSIISYLVSKREYDNLCKSIADESFKDIVTFMEEEINQRRPYLEEDVIVALLSEKYNMEINMYIDAIYNRYLKPMLFEVYSLERKDLVDKGEIKSFWIFQNEE